MDDLKSRFDAATEGIAPPPADAQRVMSRGRQVRIRRRVAGGAMTAGVLVCLVVAAANLRPPQPDEIRPTQDDPSFARYEIELGQGFNADGEEVEGVGFLEVDGGDNEICLDAAVKGATSRHLHRRDGSSEISLPDSSAPARTCHKVPGDVIGDILANHEAWYVEFHDQESGGTIDSDLNPLPQSPIEDRVASEVLEHLRRHVGICRGFDFQFKDELEGTPYRPVQCGAEIRFRNADVAPTKGTGIEAEPPSAPRYVRGPQVVVYGFQDRGSRDAWLAREQPPLGGRIYGENWVIDVIERDLYGRVAAAATPGAEEAIGPSDSLSFENRTIEPADGSKTPVSLSRAVAKARDQEELLGAELVVYSDEDVKGVDAWHIVLRRCVQNYGGEHADPTCSGEQTHVIVDAASAAILARFET
jgi:hypothetical protein